MRLTGKKIAFLGDSITEGTGVSRLENRFDKRLETGFGIIPFNMGIGGTRIAHQHTASEKPRYDLCFCGRAYDIPADSDVIVVFGGTNDYGHGDASFGQEGDKTPDTFIGAVDFLMRLLREKYPKAVKVFMTPSRRLGDSEPSVRTVPCGEKRPLGEYVRVIRDSCGKYGFACLDLYSDLGIDPNDPEQMKMYAPDGLHLNDLAHAKVASLLAEKLISM